jgi:hypothetical protein
LIVAAEAPRCPAHAAGTTPADAGRKRLYGELSMDTKTIELPEASIEAYLRLMELNLGAWRPHVAAWLHSQEAEAPLKELLTMVPCSPTLH